MSFEEIIRAAVAQGVAEGLSKYRPALPSELLKVTDAAKLANVSEATIRQWMKDGLLDRYGSSRAARVRREDVLSVRPRSPAASKSVEELAAELMGPRRRR